MVRQHSKHVLDIMRARSAKPSAEPILQFQAGDRDNQCPVLRFQPVSDLKREGALGDTRYGLMRWPSGSRCSPIRSESRKRRDVLRKASLLGAHELDRVAVPIAQCHALSAAVLGAGTEGRNPALYAERSGRAPPESGRTATEIDAEVYGVIYSGLPCVSPTSPRVRTAVSLAGAREPFSVRSKQQSKSGRKTGTYRHPNSWRGRISDRCELEEWMTSVDYWRVYHEDDYCTGNVV